MPAEEIPIITMTNEKSELQTLERIRAALSAVPKVLAPFTPGAVEAQYKSGHDPVTEADRALNELLKGSLVRDGEGWFSEESVDDLSRLDKERVWLVDPLDGTREFVAGIPEWCVSVAFIDKGRAVAAGILNPATKELFLGSIQTGVTLNGSKVQVSGRDNLAGALVLASRSEVNRGEWTSFGNAPFTLRSMGSVAYKLARVAAGLADATWTLVPKHEWDIAAGVALVEAAGGVARDLSQTPLTFNHENPLLQGLVACGPRLADAVFALPEVAARRQAAPSRP